MNDTQLDGEMSYLFALWPACKLTPQQVVEWRSALRHHQAQTVHAAMRAAYRVAQYPTPVLGDVLKHLPAGDDGSARRRAEERAAMERIDQERAVAVNWERSLKPAEFERWRAAAAARCPATGHRLLALPRGHVMLAALMHRAYLDDEARAGLTGATA
jgi:hypothetical protein